MARFFSIVFLLAAISSTLASYNNTVYLIRHGEKPPEGQGLAPHGKERAKCLTTVFGPNSTYNIGYILAQTPKKNGDRTRPLDTVTPLAQMLGLSVDTSCDRDDPDCVAKAVKKFTKENSSNILICWEHHALQDILQSLDVRWPPKYPGDAFDIIWTVQDKKSICQTSENCPGLDN